MASPLILKIQAQLDKTGFTQFQRELVKVGGAIAGVGVAVTRLQSLFVLLGRTLLGVVAAAGIRELISIAIEEERATARLTSSLAALGVEAEQTAESLVNLTTAQALNSQFSRQELLGSLNLVFRRTKDVNLALRDLAIAQEIAAATDGNLARAARALSLAQSGLSLSLARLTGLTTEQIERFRELGTLTSELERLFPIGAATGRDLETIAGGLEAFRNRITALRAELGKDLFELARPGLQGFVNALNEIPEGLLRFLINKGLIGLAGIAFAFIPVIGPLLAIGTIGINALQGVVAESRRINEEGLLMASRFDAINRILRTQGQRRNELFATTSAELNAIETSVQFFERRLALVTQALEVAQESGNVDIENVVLLERRQRVLQDTIRSEQNRRRELRDTEDTLREANRTSIREQIDSFIALNLSRREAQRREIEQERQKLQAVLDLNRASNDELKIIEAQRINNRIRALQLEQEIAVDSIEAEIDARRRLFNLLQDTQPDIDPEATDIERSRQLTALIRNRRTTLQLIEDERLSALAILRLDAERLNLDQDSLEVRRQRQVIDAEATSQRIRAEREFADAARALGEIEGRPDVAERTERRIETIRRNQVLELEKINRQRRREIRAGTELQRLEADILRLREQGIERGDDRLERLIRRAEVVREIVDATVLPTNEAAIDNLTQELERQLEISKFQVNINLNLDRVTLLQQIDTILTERLRQGGFLKAESSVAATEPDTAPGITQVELDAFGRFTREAFSDRAPR